MVFIKIQKILDSNNPNYYDETSNIQPFSIKPKSKFIVGFGGNPHHPGMKIWDSNSGLCLHINQFPEVSLYNYSQSVLLKHRWLKANYNSDLMITSSKYQGCITDQLLAWKLVS